MLRNIVEIELYLTPSMAVYKYLITSGFVHFIFKHSLIHSMVVLEEILQSSITGVGPSILQFEEAESTSI